MKIIKVDATTSTNELSKSLNTKEKTGNFCVSAEFQSKGRGQQNTVWQSNKSENLMFTVVYNNIDLDIDKRFCLNAIVCLSIYNILQKNGFKFLKLKWPNDILADGYKICGILIENSIVGSNIKNAYVGIGLNVNQIQFENLPQATSLKKLKGLDINRHKIFDDLIRQLKNLPDELLSNSPQNIINIYKRYLYGFNALTGFRLPNGDLIRGKIKSVELDGRLVVEFESGEFKGFEHKAITQLY